MIDITAQKYNSLHVLERQLLKSVWCFERRANAGLTGTFSTPPVATYGIHSFFYFCIQGVDEMRNGKPWFVLLIELCYVAGTLKSSTEKCRVCGFL